MPRIFVDSGILMIVFEGNRPDLREQAIRAIDEAGADGAVFLASRIVELETLPNMVVHLRKEQEEAYRRYFASAESVACTEAVQDLALAEACKSPGLGMGDALHVACAITGGADYILTTEKPSSRLPKTTGIPVRTIATT